MSVSLKSHLWLSVKMDSFTRLKTTNVLLPADLGLFSGGVWYAGNEEALLKITYGKVVPRQHHRALPTLGAKGLGALVTSITACDAHHVAVWWNVVTGLKRLLSLKYIEELSQWSGCTVMLGSPLDHFYQVLKMSAPRGKLCTVGFLFCSAAVVVVIVIHGCGWMCNFFAPGIFLQLDSAFRAASTSLFLIFMICKLLVTWPLPPVRGNGRCVLLGSGPPPCTRGDKIFV